MTVGPLARGELVVRPATAGEARVVHGLLVACGRDMVARHRLHHWDPPFPLELVEVDVAERDVVLVEVDDGVVATFTLGAVPDEWHEDL